MTTTTKQAHDYTALSTLADCPRKYEYGVLEGWQEKEPPLPLLAGSAGHAALNVLYTEGWDLQLALEALAEAYADVIVPPNSKYSYLTLGHLEIVLRNYFEERSEQPTALESALVHDTAEEAIVFDWTNAEGEVLRYGGKPDLPVKLAGQRYIVDHKWTTGWVNRYWALRFRIGHQFRGYCAMLSALTGKAYDGAYVNAIYMGPKAADEPEKWKTRKSSPTALFGPYDYSPGKIEETWKWAHAWQEAADLFRRIDHFPQNEMACSHYGGCEFLELCEKPPAVRAAHASRVFDKREATGLLLSGADSDV